MNNLMPTLRFYSFGGFLSNLEDFFVSGGGMATLLGSFIFNP